MIVSATGSSVVESVEPTAAQITCVVAATGLAFSTRPVSRARIIVRYVKRHIFFLKIWFAKWQRLAVDALPFKSTKSGAVEINGPPAEDKS